MLVFEFVLGWMMASSLSKRAAMAIAVFFSVWAAVMMGLWVSGASAVLAVVIGMAVAMLACLAVLAAMVRR